MTRPRRKAMWLAGTASATIAATGAGLMVAPPAHADISPGTGSAYAQGLQDTPREGSLMVGVVAGEAIAGHTDGIARAQSQGLDETAIGTSLQAYNCGTPPTATQKALVSQPLQAETGQPGADQGFTDTPSTGATSVSSSQLPPSFGSTEFAQATTTPYGEADTSYGSLSVPGAPFTVSGLTSKAFSGLVNGQREAGASVDINSIDLVGQMVQLDGLHWDVTFPSGGSAQPTGSFSIGKLVINGTTVNDSNPVAQLAAANTALQQLGLQLQMPQVVQQQGIEFVTPLELEVVPNAVRDQVLDGAVNAANPAVAPVIGGLENGFGPPEPAQVTQQLCQSDTPITVLEIAIASVDGGGSYVTSFGGVNASSGEVPANPYNLSLPSLGSLPGSSQFIPGTAGTSGSVATPGTAGTAAAPALAAGSPAGSAATTPSATTPKSSGTGGSVQSTNNIAATGFASGGPLLGIGLGALGALLLLAEADRRFMRRAQTGRNLTDFED